MTIRKAQIKDSVSLVENNLRMAYETEGKRLNKIILQKGVSAVLKFPEKGFYLIAEINGTVAGSLMITNEWSDWRNSTFWWIQSVYVLPEFRKKGIYRKLYREVKRLAKKEKNVCGIRLYVEKNNIKAQKVYEKTGMECSHYIMFEVES
ncbi:MAG: GNAT family N-acetyltransferase [Bacteroidetes bacterium RIFCSPLOWO2_02_FULL_36_8]|nr:MAG: GNAT family N-acetyltransferase [Bacteroidetes bacterium RIFCSPLOWO2_02_FULL_36_8]OFY68779.1 MAG: GNAT family N-acetyltransferase [Bacteroidetes bacterium RIFCSPLOWO2_12_FULL_37_12]